MGKLRNALLDLARLLGLSIDGVAELELAFDHPDELLAKHAKKFAERGIDKPTTDLPWIRLVDALVDEQRCAEVDWKADLDEVTEALQRLALRDASLKRVLRRVDGEPTEDMLGILGHHFARQGRALCTIDYGADSYALIVLAADLVERAQALAAAASFGKIIVWRRAPVKRPRATKGSGPALHDIASWDGYISELIALPDGRGVGLHDTDLRLLVPGEPETPRESVEDLLDPTRPAHGQLSLLRAGVRFGVVTQERVRVWPSGKLGESVTLDIEGELPRDKFDRSATPRLGGSSDRADRAIIVFHAAGSAPDTIYLARLELDLERRRATWVARADDGNPPCLQREGFPLSELAKLQPAMFRWPILQHASWQRDEVLVVAAAPGDKEHAHVARLAEDGNVELLISIEEPARACFTSCGQYVITTYRSPRRAPAQGLWSLRERAWVTPVNLVAGMKDSEIVDHDAGVWWLRRRRAIVACRAA